MATFIDGIAASENIDSSGERIQIAGMDISSLAVDGVFTYEHEAATGPKGEKINIKMPEQTVGKILKAKKIFQEADCEDDRQAYFWKKCQTPYIYIMGELFDDYTDAARDLAGKFRYDSDRLGQNERTVMNFSIEGAYIAKEGIEVTRSVARKCTITVLPCNKAARAEMVPAQADKAKNSVDSLFKTESIEIELFKTEPLTFSKMKADMDDLQKHADALGIEPMKKNVIPFKKPLTSAPGTATKPAPKATGGDQAPKLPGATSNPGRSLGSTKSGKSVMSHAKIHEYHGFSASDHQEAAHMHHSAAQGATDAKSGAHHLDKMKLHLQASKTFEHRESRFARGVAQSKLSHANMRKATDAGSGNVAPSQLTGTAALAKEDLKKVAVPGSKYPSAAAAGGKKALTVGGIPKWAPIKKSEWIERAEEEYANWDKKEEYRAFMKERMPHLADGEVDAIGKTIALKKSLDAEASLSKLIKK